MKYIEIKDRIAAELAAMLKEKKVLSFTLKQKLKTIQLTNPKEISEVREDITRINTVTDALK